ncbi:MAG: hypothetical protein H6657_04530 [Ardenticatenaceae bacterium]|nr:hypothetical protein [Ardenticatenaceae bacterium]
MIQLSNLNVEKIRRYESWLVLLLFVLLTVIAAWNIVTDLNGVIIGQDNDVYINPWADWWTLKAITDPDISLWRSELMYYPIGADLIYHSFSHLNTAVSLGLRPLLGILPAYNITILLNYVLAGLSMFHLGRYMTGSSIAGILAGIVFAFNSHNLYQSAHPVLLSIWCFPWTTLYFIRAVRENSVKLALIAAVFVFLGAATSTILIILMVFWMGLLVIYMFLSKQYPRPPWKVLVAFAAASGLLILPTVLPLLIDAIASSNSSFIIDPEESIRTDMGAFMVPHWYYWLIRGLYIGIVPFFLMMLAFGRKRRQAAIWFLITLIAYLFAIGPTPVIFNTPLPIVLPWTLPIAPVLRNMYRMMILMSLGLAMVVAYGWLGMLESIGNDRKKVLLVAAITGSLIFFEYTAVPFPSTPATVSAFFTDYLDEVPQNVAIAIIPTGRQQDKRYMYYQTIHEHPMTGGVISRAGEDVFKFITNNPLLGAGAVDLLEKVAPTDRETALAKLAEANVGFFIIDKALLNESYLKGESLLNLDDWRRFMEDNPIYEDEYIIVYPTAERFLSQENIFLTSNNH